MSLITLPNTFYNFFFIYQTKGEANKYGGGHKIKKLY